MKDDNYYYKDGKKYDRVTRACSVATWTPKAGKQEPQLAKWYGDNGTEFCRGYTQDMSEIGTQVHDFIKRICNGYSFCTAEGKLVWSQLDERIKNSLKAWEQARQYLKFKPIKNETFVYSPIDMVAGTVDCFAIIKKKLCLLDWKTSSQLWENEVKLQLSAYYNIWNIMAIKNVSACMAVRLDRDGKGFNPKTDLLTMTVQECEDLFPVFLNCLEVWRYSNGYNHKETGR